MTPKSILDFLPFKDPTTEQVTVLKAMEEFIFPDNPDDFLVLCGSAGTGKTSITSALIGFLNQEEIKYKIAAPTGRAARILGRKANTTASTIHSMIYIPVTDEKTGKVSFIMKDDINQDPAIFIIDEASMIPSEVTSEDTLFEVQRALLFDLVDYVKRCHVNNKIIFL